ncbi:MAG: pentapeptide repeat-containing protein [Cyanobacteria bacterium P01_D01_bin.116]
MKASEVLGKYKAGERNFRCVNLRGQSFKGKDLSGADFSKADIRGADFANAILIDAKFCDADIRGANFAKSDLTKADFTDAIAGLKKYWAVLLVIVSYLLLGFSGFSYTLAGYLAALTFNINLENQKAGWINLILLIPFFFVTIRQSTVAGAVGITFIVIGVITVTYFLFEVTNKGVTGVVFGGFIAALVTFLVTLEIIFVVTFAMLGAYIGWRALVKDEKYLWIRSLAITFASMGSTSFYCANLTDAKLINTKLKGADFRNSTLLRTRFYNSKMLSYVRSEKTYLQDEQVCQLLVTGQANKLNFNHKNLRGVNLCKASLVDSSFIGADLSEANLQDADLSGAILKKTQLDGTNFTGVTITGACIEDWGITNRTKLYNVKCDYVFMRLIEASDPDLKNRYRQPACQNFASGEFVDFITPLVQTLDLYHNQVNKPQAIVIAFNELCKKYPEAKIKPIAIERRGKNKDGVLIKAETSPQADHFQLHAEYFNTYEDLRTLSLETLQALLKEKQSIIHLLAGVLETKYNTPKVSINNSQHQGDTNMTGDRTVYTGGGNYNERIEGDYIQGSYYAAGEKQTLAEAAAEIQQLLEQLEQFYPTTTTSEQMIVASEAIKRIKSNPTLKQLVINAVKEHGSASFEKAIDNSTAAFIVGAIRSWQKVETE